MASFSQAPDDDRLYPLIQSRTGLILNEHQRIDVGVLLDDLAKSLHASSAPDLFSLLSQSPSTHPIWQRIVHVITVGETYFFRHMAQFDALRSHILPPLIEERRKEGHKRLSLWSAGSATGEEAYTLAILLRQILPDIESWVILILATDINETYLQQARYGLYRSRSFRSETPPEVRDLWFAPESDGYRLSPKIRNMVSFELLNLVSDDYPSFETSTLHMDVIFCRNVTIYFDRQTTRQIAQRFRSALNPNGWLVVGHSEPQSDVYQGFLPRNFKDTVVYQKLATETQPSLLSVPIQPPSRVTQPLKKPTPGPKAPKPISDIKTPKPISEAKALTLSSEDLWKRAKQAADLRQWTEARQWLDQAEQKDKFRPEVHYLRALVELETGNINQALSLLRQAIYCNVNFSLAHYTLGDLYAHQGSQKEAVRHWKLALGTVETMDPKQPLPYSDGLNVEMFITMLVDRLTGL